MTTINTIEDLARILRDQPTWAEALRALILTQDLLDLPARLDRFIQEQQEFNQRQQEFNRRQEGFNQEMREFKEEQLEFNRNATRRFNNIEGRLGNLEGGQYERTVRTRALARSQIVLGFRSPYVALNQEGLTDPRLNSAIARAIQNGRLTHEGFADLFETDIIISAEDNRHAVIEVSLTVDRDDINRAKSRAGILAAITDGTVTPVVVTARLEPVQSAQAEAAAVTTFFVPYP